MIKNKDKTMTRSIKILFTAAMTMAIVICALSYFVLQKYTDKSQRGLVVILDGTSNAGKTSIVKELLPLLGTSYEKVSLDDFVTEVFVEQQRLHFSQEELLRRHYQRTSDMYGEIRKRVSQGKNVIVDTVFSGHEGEKDVRQGVEKLKGLSVFMVLAYCPLPQLAERLEERNAKAFSENNPEGMSSLALAVKFDDVYRTVQSENDVVLDELLRKDVEDAYDQSRVRFDSYRDKFDEVKSSSLLTHFGLDDKESTGITPRLQYDIIINTGKYTPKECAQQIYGSLNTSHGMALESNCKSLFGHTVVFGGAVLSDLRKVWWSGKSGHAISKASTFTN